MRVEDAAAKIVGLFGASGGATFNLYFGDMVNTPHFAASLYPEARHSKFWSGSSLTPFKVRSFIADNRLLLEDPRHGIGVWYDTERNRTYLEVTATLPFRDKADYTGAVRQGRRFNQIGIYDLEEGAYISLGGTGELPAGVPPVAERLPARQRGRVYE